MQVLGKLLSMPDLGALTGATCRFSVVSNRGTRSTSREGKVRAGEAAKGRGMGAG